VRSIEAAPDGLMHNIRSDGGEPPRDQRFRGPVLYTGPTFAWPIWLAYLALAIPTFISMAQLSWSSEAGAHGPIVLATGAWLFYHNREKIGLARTMPTWITLAAIVPLLVLWGIGRIAAVLALESLALYGIGLVLMASQFGPKVLLRLWFPFAYLLFMITPPENWMVVGTQPLKLGLSTAAVDLAQWFGLTVGRTGVIIQVDGYQLLVATACSGVNSLFGICAITSFYVYLMHGSEPRYAAVLVATLLPVAILANLIRVVMLIFITHYFGEEVMEGIIHSITGIGMFVLSLVILLALDRILHPIMQRVGWAR
jgi:exosortase